METNKSQKQKSTLLILLDCLQRQFNYSDVMLEREYGLNRYSLRKIRKGNDLPNAHTYYYQTLLQIVYNLYLESLGKNETEKSKALKDLLFNVMLLENGVI